MKQESKPSRQSGQPSSESSQGRERQSSHLSQAEWERVVRGAKKLYSLLPEKPELESPEDIKLSQMD